MPFNVKNYLAIGLGIGVAAFFYMHKSTPQKPVAFEAPSGEFKPLSSLNDTPEISAPPISAELIAIQPGVMVDSGEHQEGSSQVGFENEGNSSSDNDFVVPDAVQGSLELAPAMLQDPLNDFDFQAEPMAKVAETEGTPQLEATELATPAAEMVEELALTVVQTPNCFHQQPQSRWNGNPFLGQAQPANVPATDDNTIHFERDGIKKVEAQVEPAAQDMAAAPTAQDMAAAPTAQDMAAAPTAQDRTAGPTAQDMSAGDTSVKSIQFETTGMEDAAKTGRDESPGFSAEEVAPLQLGISEAIAIQAAQHIEYGKSLARRGSAFSARQEFFSALRVIAQSNDAATGSNDFSRALSHSILAMNEAKDFVMQDAETEAVLNAGEVIETHRSEILNQSQAESLTPQQAMKQYMSFAQQKLDEAGGRNVVTAEALYCLGKLQTAISQNQTSSSNLERVKAVVFHQAALMSDENHYRSANELGVLLARTGQLEEATELFKQSLIVRSTPSTWRNLANTHRRLGQHDLAQLADTEFAMAAQRPVTDSSAEIRWMPTTQFNAAAPLEHDERVASKPGIPAAVKPETNFRSEKTRKKSLSEKIKDLF